MNVLLLSPYPEKIIQPIQATDSVIHTAEAITPEFLRSNKIDFLVSYGYRHLIKEPILTDYHHKIVNLHISCLPWNRGTNPNFWAWYEQTPNGVSIHYVDAGIDTGPILLQKLPDFPPGQTLDSSYLILKKTIEELFAENWANIRTSEITPQPQTHRGTFHTYKMKDDLWYLFPKGGSTPVEEVVKMGKKYTGPNL